MAQDRPLFAGARIVIREAEFDLTFESGQDAYGQEIFLLTREAKGSRITIAVGPEDRARLQARLRRIEHLGYRLKGIKMEWGGDIPQVEVELKSGVNFIHFRDFKARVMESRAYADLLRELERVGG
ncbi:MAG TPA: hypothetical protein VJ600_11335 [Holophagaceae bacterium]|nr:hypothetical protein [Holophagaceae bacterium]